MKRHSISLALALCLFGSTAEAGFIDAFKKGWGNSPIGQASDIGSLGANFSNITSPQSIDGTYYGGSIEFKVDANSAVFQPWADFKEPSVKATCGSFTLDGGFIDLLGLEDIAEQLGNASGAIVYGLFIALVNSMPSIEHVFSGIKRMIQQIQGLLANACNIGQGLGNKALSTVKVRPGWGMQGAIDNAQAILNKSADKVEEAIKDGLDKVTSPGLEKDQKKKEAEKMFGSIFKLYDYTPLIATTIANQWQLSTKEFHNFQQGEVRGTDVSEIMYLFAVNIFGIPETMSPDFYRFLDGNDGQGKNIPEWIAKGELKGKDKETEALKNLLAKEGRAEAKGETTKANSNADLFKSAYSGQPAKSPEQLINELLKGGKGGQIELYSTKILFGMAKAHTEVLTFMATMNFDEKVKLKWKGLVNESQEVIKCRKNNKSGKCASGSINLIVPGAMDMLNTIVTLEGMAKNTDYDPQQRAEFTNQAADLEYILAKSNAYYCAQYFLANLQAQKTEGVALVTGKGSMTTQEMTRTISILEKYLKGLYDDLMGKTKKLHEFKTPFEAADKAMKEMRNKASSAKAKTKGQ